MWLPVSVRTKQYDTLRLEPRGNLLCNFGNVEGNIGIARGICQR